MKHMNRKKWISLVLAAALTLSLAAPAMAAEGPAPWYAEAQAYVTEKDLMTGTENGFDPEAPVTQATVLQTLYNLEGKPAATGEGEWYTDAVNWAGALGLTEAKDFADAVITRGEVSALLETYCAAKESDPQGLMVGNENGEQMADKELTRAEFAQILVRLAAKELPVYGAVLPLQILATSDLHGWFVPWDFSEDVPSTRGSLTYLATLIKARREENPNTILVDCGDTVQSNYVEYFIDHEKNPMLTAMNALGYDVWTFGNHEYNFSLSQRQALVDQFQGAALSGNVFMKDSGEPYLPATAVVERGGVKVGFVGMTTPLIVEFEKGKTSLDEVEVRSPLDCIGKAIEDLKAQNVDAIVGLIHEGLEEENSVPGSGTKDLAEAFPDFDIIISGHAHAAVESETVNGVLLCEPNYNARSLSALHLAFAETEEGWKLVNKSAKLLSAGSVEDPEMVELMKPYQEELSAHVNTPIGQLINKDLVTPEEIPGSGAANMGSVPMLNLMSTAGIFYSGADFTIYNPTYENPGCTVGGISIKDISSGYQFTGGEVSVYPITGAQLKTLLEWVAGYYNTWQEGDLTVSFDPVRRESKYSTNFVGGGIVYTVDVTQEVGSRIQGLALIVKDEAGNPTFDKDGALITTPIEDDTPLNMGAHDYYVRQWVAEGGCWEGQTLTATYSTSDEFGDDGTVRNLTIRYIKEYLKGVVNGDKYDYVSWSVSSGIDKTSEAYQKMLQQLSDGTIQVPSSEAGRTNIAPITEADLK